MAERRMRGIRRRRAADVPFSQTRFLREMTLSTTEKRDRSLLTAKHGMLD